MFNLLPTIASLPTLPLAGFWFRKPASTVAGEVDYLYMLILYISIVFFIIIVGGMALFVFWFRQRPGHTEQPSPSHDNRLEIAWTVIPTLIVILIFFLGFTGFMNMATPPDNAYEINVIAQKWNWTFRYNTPNGVVDASDLHVWKDQPFKLVQQSQDVIHSLYVPAFRIKMDCVPGRYTYQWFEVDELPDPEDDDNRDNRPHPESGLESGVGYDLFCTEYCGTGHSTMWAKVIVHNTKEEFEAWLEKASDPFHREDGSAVPLEEVGESLYRRKGCSQCHSIDGSAKQGPSFKGTFGTTQQTDKGDVVVDENYIRESLLDPNAKIRSGYRQGMPTFQGSLRDTPEYPEIDAIIAFIKSLKD